MAQEAALKSKLLAFYGDVLQHGKYEALDAFCAENYLPHCAELKGVPVLAPGLGALRERLATRGPIPHALYRVVADGDMVFAQTRYDGGVPIAGADIFKFDAQGLIAEHWNSRQTLPHDTERGVDRFAGGGDAGLPMGDGRRDAMKRVMREILTDAWSQGNAALVPKYYAPEYVQHNPDMPGGYTRIKEVIEVEIRKYIEASGGPFPIDLHLIGAEGDLIFIYYSIFMAGINRGDGARSTNTDIFRIGADNRMIEHWDVLQLESEPLPDDRTLF